MKLWIGNIAPGTTDDEVRDFVKKYAPDLEIKTIQRVEGDGSFVMSSAGAFDGLPVGDYVITVTTDDRFALDGKKPVLTIPEKYTKPATSDLAATIKSGTNEVILDLKK